MTITRRQMALGTLAVVLLLVARYLTRSHEVVETVTPENPLVIDVPKLRVVSGDDTLTIMGPALFAYVGLDAEDQDPPPRLLDAVAALESALEEAEPGLGELGVRVFSVVEPPVPVEVAPDVWAAAGPRLAPGTVGVLFADPQRRVLRMDRVTGGAALVCAAARTFGRSPPSPYAALCR